MTDATDAARGIHIAATDPASHGTICYPDPQAIQRFHERWAKHCVDVDMDPECEYCQA